MNALVKTNFANVPDFLKDAAPNTAIFDAAIANISASLAFPTLSIRASAWHLRYPGGEEERTLDSRTIEVVFALVNKNLTKQYYKDKYNERQENAKPTCWSNDGETPDPTSAEIQSSRCKTCRWNAFGTADVGNGKACQDRKRLIVYVLSEGINDFFLMSIPPASLSDFRTYVESVRKYASQKVSLDNIVTRMSFDSKASFPKVQFDLHPKFVSKEVYNAVKEAQEDPHFMRVLTRIDTTFVDAVEVTEEEAPKFQGTPPQGDKETKQLHVKTPLEDKVDDVLSDLDELLGNSPSNQAVEAEVVVDPKPKQPTPPAAKVVQAVKTAPQPSRVETKPVVKTEELSAEDLIKELMAGGDVDDLDDLEME